MKKCAMVQCYGNMSHVKGFGSFGIVSMKKIRIGRATMKGTGRLALTAAAAAFVALAMLQPARAETAVKGYIVESSADQVKLTLEQAVQWAKESSHLLKAANQNVERNAIMLQSAADELKQVTRRDNHDGEDDNGPSDAEALRAAYKRYEAAASMYEDAQKQVPLPWISWNFKR